MKHYYVSIIQSQIQTDDTFLIQIKETCDIFYRNIFNLKHLITYKTIMAQSVLQKFWENGSNYGQSEKRYTEHFDPINSRKSRTQEAGIRKFTSNIMSDDETSQSVRCRFAQYEKNPSRIIASCVCVILNTVYKATHC